jgi:hypothetical protein
MVFAMFRPQNKVPLIVGMIALEAFRSFSLLLHSPSARAEESVHKTFNSNSFIKAQYVLIMVNL